ncbi:N-acetylglucosamine-6-phosphate deacetylase [Sporosarcina sp.]|uniref:N-acetylglucosamine-6-phosphate deacetylase n=1 Tax=Sporosarcina sp. TaxID=49982 RepID=UPI002615FAEB|nr:N-acetylglucosamine-6-phosphate deacetylase [Sporosarcina sp.]
MNYFIKADKALLENEERQMGYLEVKDGVFGEFIDEVPENAEVKDWSGYLIAPGLFDTHIHGIQGHDVMDGTAEAVYEISRAIVELGVTRFLPTTLTSSDEALEQAIVAVTEATKNSLPGAESEGLFLEGPYFTEKHKGAQNPGYFKDPNVAEFNKWQKLANGQIVKIALAPEREHAMDFIQKVSDTVLVSIAHTDADYGCCKDAIDHGARNFVHLFNGMSGVHHREPGAVGAALTDSRAYAELICDGHHVHPVIAAMALENKKDKLMLITDCMRAGLMPDDNYYLGEFPVTIMNGIARTETGSLAGSTLKLIDGVKNLQSWSSLPLYEIWHRGSLTPAASLGKADRLGSIKKGKAADYVVLDEQLTIMATAVDGLVKYKKM